MLRKGEQIKASSERYKATFESPEHRRYRASLSLIMWQSLHKGTEYQLGRNAFGVVRNVSAAVNRGRQGVAEPGS